MADDAVSLHSLEYRCGTTRLEGFAAVDNRQSGPRPGVVIAHDAWGVGEHVKLRARMLAELGYVALAIDLYGDGIKPQTMNEARAQVDQLRSNPDLLRERALAGLNALAALTDVDRSRLGAIGHCFGGTTVLEMARAGVDCAVIVSFHGILTTSRPAQAGSIKSRLLVCTGAEDPLVPLNDVTAFQLEMRAAAADCQTIIYNGAQHGFANPYSSNNPGIAHHPAADRRSWMAMRNLFDEAFGSNIREA